MKILIWVKRIHRMIEKNRHDALGILLRKYPSFVLSDRVDNVVEIPAFVFHHVTAESLEPMLQFLVDNRYATLTADEYIERQMGQRRRREREVLLTFDDGLKSLYTVAYPALRRLGLKAVAYIVPGMTPEDADAGGADRLCTWKEIQEMHESGVLDIQSHSMYHHSIPISDRVIDFIRPNMDLSFLTSDLAPLISEAGWVRKSDQLAYGTPIYVWGSRFDRRPAFQEEPSVVRACREYVHHHGGVEYFRTWNWRSPLRVVEAEVRRRCAHRSRFETDAEQRGAILKDFVNSKQAIERRLPGKTVRHFCFPWFRGSVLAAELSVEAGYISNAWASILPSFVRRDRPPVPIARLSAPYLWRLPGKGRRSLRAVLVHKFGHKGRGRVPIEENY
jgi:hypothetical protein